MAKVEVLFIDKRLCLIHWHQEQSKQHCPFCKSLNWGRIHLAHVALVLEQRTRANRAFVDLMPDFKFVRLQSIVLSKYK